ncbi:MAG TPA: hypothetical protein VEI57_18390 [Nitrospirota bacterium]|nr:hypothetical protein [Nitrospirota bacterium]
MPDNVSLSGSGEVQTRRFRRIGVVLSSCEPVRPSREIFIEGPLIRISGRGVDGRETRFLNQVNGHHARTPCVHGVEGTPRRAGIDALEGRKLLVKKG